MVKNKWWKAAVELVTGDILVSSDGKEQVVKSIKVEEKGYPVTTYNLTVEDNHTFFVSNEKVLTHNTTNMLKKCNYTKEISESIIDGVENPTIKEIIFERVNGLDLSEHQLTSKQLSSKKMSEIKIIRKYTNLSIGDIKDKIINNEYVMVCGYTDEDGIKNIVKAYKEVTSLGANVIVYEHDRVTTVDFLMNLINMYSDIARDMQEMDDSMYDED